MTDQQVQASLEVIFNAYARIRELQQTISEEREKIDKFSGKETFEMGGFLAEYHDRIEDYIRGKDATALKGEAPDLFAKYGKTSITRTLRVHKAKG